MANTLRAGGLGNPSPARGKPPAFAGSMAEAMENALNELLDEAGMPTFDVDDNSPETRDRRRLFVAIARGIVRHLDDNDAAFVIWSAPDAFGHRVPTGEIVEIETA
jgi:hypothetical protein